MVGKRRQRGAVDDDFRVAKRGGGRIAQVERHDLRFANAIQHRLRQLKTAQVVSQAHEPVGGGAAAHRKSGVAQQTLVRKVGGNSAAYKTGRAG